MKKNFILFVVAMVATLSVWAQVPQTLTYQAVVRDTANRLVANKTVTVTGEIFNGDAQAAAYTETHTNVQTN